MSTCIWCSRSGWFLSLSSEGLCNNCRPAIIMEAQQRIRILNDSRKIVDASKNLETRLSRLKLLLEHAHALKRFEDKGISITNPSVSTLIDSYSGKNDEIILAALQDDVATALKKSASAASLSSIISPLQKVLVKIREYIDKVTTKTSIQNIEKEVLNKIISCQLDSYLEAAKKAEFKNQKKKALDQYYEALYLLRHDDVDDNVQEALISKIEEKIRSLGGELK